MPARLYRNIPLALSDQGLATRRSHLDYKHLSRAWEKNSWTNRWNVRVKCRYVEELEAEFDRLQPSEPEHLILEDDTTSIPLRLSEEVADKILSFVHTNGI